MTLRASGIHPDRGVAINAAASAGAELLNRQAAVAVARVRVEETRHELKAIEVQLLLTQEPRP